MLNTQTMRYFFYGLLGLPLAMVALPVYVQIPAYYTTQFNMPLTGVGLVLFFSRMIDTAQDPWLGQLIDRFRLHMRIWFCLGTGLLIVAFYGLWLPPVAIQNSTPVLLAWLGVMLILTYTAHSMLNIAYLTWGARIEPAKPANSDLLIVAGVKIEPTITTHKTASQEELLKVAAWREVLGIVGVVIASIIPYWILMGDKNTLETSQQLYVLGFALILIIAIFALLFGAPAWSSSKNEEKSSLRQALSDRNFRQFLPIYFINSLSVAIPASLLLFFVQDQIQASDYTAHFLVAYFLAGAIGLPAWLALAKKKGAATTWKLGMLLAVLSFIGAAFLSSGDIAGFLIVCIASGLALGADLCLPPVLLASIIPAKNAAASYFGVWTLLAKLALAVSSLSLPLLSFLNYKPGQGTADSSQYSLLITYALIPCILKLLSLAWLHYYTNTHSILNANTITLKP